MPANPSKGSKAPLSEADFHALLDLRSGLRSYLRWSEERVRKEGGITPAWHELLLAVRGHAGPEAPSVRDISQALLIRHHSAVGLVDRAEAVGLVTRKADTKDRRVVRVRLTPKATRTLDKLAALHRDELSRLSGKIQPIWRDLA